MEGGVGTVCFFLGRITRHHCNTQSVQFLNFHYIVNTIIWGRDLENI